MKLSIVIPTFNRDKLLQKSLQSIDGATIPVGLEVSVTVVNNNSTDETSKVIESFQEGKRDFKLKAIFELNQGRSIAVNTGIKNSNCDLVAIIDDDIQISPDWFNEIYKAFSEKWNETDFMGGKVLPNWETEPPAWVKEIRDVGICWRDYGETGWNYSESTPILTGGHAILKRDIFDQLGYYPEDLGVKKKNLISCEDDVMFDRLLSNGKKGVYNPRLVVFHFVPKYRLTKSYFRQWHIGAGMSWDVVEQNYKSYQGAKFMNVPRYLYREAFLGLGNKIKAVLKGDESNSLKSEKGVLTLGGFFYSRNLKGTLFGEKMSELVKRVVTIAER